MHPDTPERPAEYAGTMPSFASAAPIVVAQPDAETTEHVAGVARTTAPASDLPPVSVTIAEAIEIYAGAGVPRADRSLQRYCARGDLDCSKVYNETEVHYLITRASIDRHIAHLKAQPQPIQFRYQPPERDPEQEPAASPRPVGNVLSLRRSPNAQLTQQIVVLQAQSQHQAEQNALLRDQIAKKDEIITHMMERERTTTQIIASLQQMLGRFLSGPGNGQS